jgi:hypothetical protein
LQHLPISPIKGSSLSNVSTTTLSNIARHGYTQQLTCLLGLGVPAVIHDRQPKRRVPGQLRTRSHHQTFSFRVLTVQWSASAIHFRPGFAYDTVQAQNPTHVRSGAQCTISQRTLSLILVPQQNLTLLWKTFSLRTSMLKSTLTRC